MGRGGCKPKGSSGRSAAKLLQDNRRETALDRFVPPACYIPFSAVCCSNTVQIDLQAIVHEAMQQCVLESNMEMRWL